MLLLKEKIVWEESEHPWNDFGYMAKMEPDYSDPAYAKVIATWKKQTLGEIVEKVVEAASSFSDYIDDPEIVSSFALAITVVNLIPLHVKFVSDDEIATQYLELIELDDEGYQYIDEANFADQDKVAGLIDYFVSVDVLQRRGGKLYVAGKVLRKAHVAASGDEL